jgi:hypothetical protein
MMPCTEALHTQLGLFTGVRGRGILRSWTSDLRSSTKFATRKQRASNSKNCANEGCTKYPTLATVVISYNAAELTSPALMEGGVSNVCNDPAAVAGRTCPLVCTRCLDRACCLFV